MFVCFKQGSVKRDGPPKKTRNIDFKILKYCFYFKLTITSPIKNDIHGSLSKMGSFQS